TLGEFIATVNSLVTTIDALIKDVEANAERHQFITKVGELTDKLDDPASRHTEMVPNGLTAFEVANLRCAGDFDSTSFVITWGFMQMNENYDIKRLYILLRLSAHENALRQFEGLVGKSFSNNEVITDDEWKVQVFWRNIPNSNKVSQPTSGVICVKQINVEQANSRLVYNLVGSASNNPNDDRSDSDRPDNDASDDDGFAIADVKAIGECASDTCTAPTTTLSAFCHISWSSVANKANKLYQNLLSKHTKTADTDHLQQVYMVTIRDAVN
ncbi:hypothetical protein GGF37_001402, partial [Kickxella alabastrina]